MNAETMQAVIALLVAIVTILGAVGAFFGIFSRFSKVLDRNTSAINNINDTIKAQWTRIDEHADELKDHGVRLIEIETTHKIKGCVEARP